MIGFFRKHYATHTRGVVAAAVASAAGAMAEASVLVLLVPLAERATLNDDEVSGRLSMFRIELSADQMLGLVLALVVLSAFAKFAALWARSRTVRSWERRERVRALRALLDADYEYTSRLSPAELQTVVGGHVSQAAQGLSIIGQVVNAAISLAILVAVAFSTAPLAALIIAVVGAGLLGLMRPLARLTRRAGAKSSEFGIEAGRLVADTARDGREIRLYGAQDHFIERYRQAVTRHEAVRLRINMTSGLAPILYQGAGLFLVVLALGIALKMSELDVTTIGAVALLFLRSLGYGQQLSNTQQQYSQVVPHVERLDEELDALGNAAERYGDRDLDSVEFIELTDVSYRYPTGGEQDGEEGRALRGIDLELRSPSVVGLAGASGSGKSTLAQLLLRLRHPTAGRLLVNGQDIAEYSRESWTRQVALVPQYPQLIRGTARENIEFFRSGLTDEDVDRVVRAVGLHDLFASFPDGYDTELGETGREISGGQLQRVGIARALISRPSFLVLDEPTSALDAESERWVERAIREISQEALVVIISHRASTLEVCDRIIRLGDGRVLEDVRSTLSARPDPIRQAGSPS